MRIATVGTSFKVVGVDGHDLNGPQEISDTVIEVGQGQRYDLEVTMPTSGAVQLVDITNGEVATIGRGEAATVTKPETWPRLDLTSYGTPTEGSVTLASHFDQTFPIVLGNRPGFRFGAMQFIHTINGQAFPDTPTVVVREGQLVHLHIVNQTNEAHPIHIHGHVFQLLALNGKELSGSPVTADTFLVPPFEEADVAFLADNPGLWMLHCHVLVHANSGMDMMVVYPNISTPFRIGTKSGNFPD